MKNFIRHFSHRFPKPEKTCAVLRYGAMGDALQTSSVLPFLKEQGFHITVFCIPNGWVVLKNNPHIDRFIVQNIDDVPNEWLGDFVKHLEKTYTKVVNLSGSVEGTLLAMPGRINHSWSHEMRHKHLNKNYLEFMHDITGVPYEPKVKFYPTKEERSWAVEEYWKIRLKDIKKNGKVILWSLGGSAVHKHWPQLDQAVEAITSVGISIVTVGDKDCQIQERGLEENPRVFCRSWKWTMRQSLSFAQVCDLVIGPETGLLNGVSFETVPKIVLMSHSSIENLTRDWVNTESLVPSGTPCYPCHRLHFGFDYCSKGFRDGQLVGALCQVNITVEQMIDAVNKQLFKIERKAA